MDCCGLWTDFAARLADRIHVVRYDVREAGKSDASNDRSRYRLDVLAADLVAVAGATSLADG